MTPEYWKPDRIFEGERVFCLASGPSMSAAVAGMVRSRPSIVVNSTFNLAPWADVLYWTDNAWFLPRRQQVLDFRGLRVTSNRRCWQMEYGSVRLIKTELFNKFRLPSGNVRQGRTSGHTAICLAIAMGAAEVVLLGYDMRFSDDGREHHHSEYANHDRPRDIYKNDFVPSFSGWNEQALDAGVRILNATPGSAVKEFETVSLEEVLR